MHLLFLKKRNNADSNNKLLSLNITIHMYIPSCKQLIINVKLIIDNQPTGIWFESSFTYMDLYHNASLKISEKWLYAQFWFLTVDFDFNVASVMTLLK